MDEVIDYLGHSYSTGWIHDEKAVEEVVSHLQYKDISETPIGNVPVESLPKTICLWKHAEKILNKKNLDVRNQSNLGSCVGFGTATAITLTYLNEIANGDPEEFKYMNPAVIYAGSRVEVGGNGSKSPFRGDGSIGAWAAAFCMKWGSLANEKYGQYDLNKYDIPQTRVWAANGLPDELLSEAKKHPISNATMVKTVEDAWRSLANGHGISICSSQGFNTKRDANGICSPSGNWSHCMCLTGVHHINDVLYFFVENSWGSYMGISNPAPFNANLGTFLAKGDVVAKMLKMNDTFAYAGYTGFEKKDNLDWSF